MIGTFRFFALLAMFTAAPGLAAESDSEVLVLAYMDAYNAHDIDAMLVSMSDDVRWMTIVGNDIETESKGKEIIRTAMSALFMAMPAARSEIREIQSLGNLVSVIEEAFWVRGNESGSQCALSVYEIDGSLIRYVWYFEAQACPLPGE